MRCILARLASAKKREVRNVLALDLPVHRANSLNRPAAGKDGGSQTGYDSSCSLQLMNCRAESARQGRHQASQPIAHGREQGDADRLLVARIVGAGSGFWMVARPRAPTAHQPSRHDRAIGPPIHSRSRRASGHSMPGSWQTREPARASSAPHNRRVARTSSLPLPGRPNQPVNRQCDCSLLNMRVRWCLRYLECRQPRVSCCC